MVTELMESHLSKLEEERQLLTEAKEEEEEFIQRVTQNNISNLSSFLAGEEEE